MPLCYLFILITLWLLRKFWFLFLESFKVTLFISFLCLLLILCLRLFQSFFNGDLLINLKKNRWWWNLFFYLYIFLILGKHHWFCHEYFIKSNVVSFFYCWCFCLINSFAISCFKVFILYKVINSVGDWFECILYYILLNTFIINLNCCSNTYYRIYNA